MYGTPQEDAHMEADAEKHQKITLFGPYFIVITS